MKIKTLLPFTWVLLAGIGTANATCKQVDAKGTWITYQAAFVTLLGEQHVGQCKLVVDKTGNVLDPGSVCEFVTFETGPIPTSGNITVNKDCSADINLTLGNLIGQVQIAKNKQTFTGRFSAQGGEVSGTTNGVKQ